MTVTTPGGFTAAGIAAGIKSNGQLDLALIVNTGPLKVGAAVFTSNRFQAAPVLWSQEAIKNGQVNAVILNSGGANACTGAPGFADTQRTAEHVAETLATSATDVLVCSTGLIGTRLPLDSLLAGASTAAAQLSTAGGEDAAKAIMTTDTKPKNAAAAISTPNGTYGIGGIAKGAGMLAPALATMLVVITTDAVLTTEKADQALRAATAHSFDRIDSDGCMSTNDTVILLASGASGIVPELSEFTQELTAVSHNLAQQLIGDAEGASHDIAITVSGAATETAALEVARAIGRSNLFKTAIFGNDPNWGRILSAAGTVPVNVAPYDPAQVDVTINGVMVCQDGGIGQDRDLVDLSANREVTIEVNLKAGTQQATIWTNDLTHDYVHENSAYSS